MDQNAKRLREKTFASNVAAGKTLKQSMIDAGYPISRANRGVAGMSKRMISALGAEGYKLAEFGKSLSVETLKNIAIGRLATNAINGKDGGIMSAKTLGSHRELNLWTPESQAGVIVINSPSVAIEKKSQMLEDDPQT